MSESGAGHGHVEEGVTECEFCKPKVVMAVDPHDQAADPPPYPTET